MRRRCFGRITGRGFDSRHLHQTLKVYKAARPKDVGAPVAFNEGGVMLCYYLERQWHEDETLHSQKDLTLRKSEPLARARHVVRRTNIQNLRRCRKGQGIPRGEGDGTNQRMPRVVGDLDPLDEVAGLRCRESLGDARRQSDPLPSGRRIPCRLRRPGKSIEPIGMRRTLRRGENEEPLARIDLQANASLQ